MLLLARKPCLLLLTGKPCLLLLTRESLLALKSGLLAWILLTWIS